jgi:urocanate hydratase
MDYSQHSEVVIGCDEVEAADRRIARTLWNASVSGVMRHADAGYGIAKACVREMGLKLPMV